MGQDPITVMTNQQALCTAGLGGEDLQLWGHDGGCRLPRAGPGLRQAADG